jgi:16S rRNA (cytidine1402-2'-O)-methyltransferase
MDKAEQHLSAEPGILYVVATPIGHLADLSRRAVAILRSVSTIACEDTRVSRVLTQEIGSSAPLLAADQYREQGAATALIKVLQDGGSAALISDAGTPGVSDPGAILVRTVRAAGFKVVPIPGANAVTTLLSAAGFVNGKFFFEGFLPSGDATRMSRLKTLSTMQSTIVLFEAPHRIHETMAACLASFGPDREVAIGRELTKRFEEIHVCSLSEVAAWLAADPYRSKGEYVLALNGAPEEIADQGAARALLSALLEEVPPSQAARVAAKILGWPRQDAYKLALELKAGSTKDSEE